MGWTYPWASSLSNDFNFDFNVSFKEEQQCEGVVEYNYRRGGHAMDETQVRSGEDNIDGYSRHYYK
jgi:predicted dithiol-disulfide oxidoreductase (DUF899 family)